MEFYYFFTTIFFSHLTGPIDGILSLLGEISWNCFFFLEDFLELLSLNFHAFGDLFGVRATELRTSADLHDFFSGKWYKHIVKNKTLIINEFL